MDLTNYTPIEFQQINDHEALNRSQSFHQLLATRRSIRRYARKPVARGVIENAIRAAGCAPSGANKQPWVFSVVYDQSLKSRIRVATEEVERDFYTHRAGEEWLSDLRPLGTEIDKAHIEDAGCLIAVFSKTKDDFGPSGSDRTYYPVQSTCLATGILLAALHNAGLATLVHTPKPMKYLNKILGFEKHFSPQFLLAVGYPVEPVLVPKIEKKSFEEIARIYE